MILRLLSFRLAAAFLGAAAATVTETTTSATIAADQSALTSPTPGCSLAPHCENGSTCKAGEANYSSLLSEFHTGSHIPFLSVTSRGGEYCDGCPEGYTGVDCSHEYEICDPHGVKLPCFHGGSCQEMDFGWKCACTGRASNYMGRHCQHPVTDICDANSTGKFVCANGGQCQKGETDPMKKCKCTDGWVGLHCGLHPLDSHNQHHGRNCSLSCENGGKCHFVPYGSSTTFPESGFRNGTKLPSHWMNPTNTMGMLCICPDGYEGPSCEVESAKCGEDGVCFHGATCKSIRSAEDATQFIKYCDCGDAGGGHFSQGGHEYVGKSCQHSSKHIGSTLCETPGLMGSGSASSNLHSGKMGMIFCANGGICTIKDGHHGCDCPDGYSGHHCEFHESENCTTPCWNGGHCVRGGMHTGMDGSSPEYLQAMAKRLGFNHPEGLHPNVERCHCPLGFTGPKCGVRLTVCGDDQHICAHGAKCMEVGVDSKTGKSTFACDCGEGKTEGGLSVAGRHCEYHATDFCVKGDTKGQHSFCSNQGRCKMIIEGHERHAGCICNEGWSGDHCELKLEVGSTSKSTEGPNHGPMKLAIAGLGVSIVIISMIIIGVIITKRRMQSLTDNRSPSVAGVDARQGQEEQTVDDQFSTDDDPLPATTVEITELEPNTSGIMS